MSLRRVGVLLTKEFLYGSRGYIFIFSVVGPILISVVISLAFGTWLAEAPKIGIVDTGDSRMVILLQELDSVESREYDSPDDMKQSVEEGQIDMGIVLPVGFDGYVIEGEETEIQAYLWGESLAKSRTIIGVTLADLIREIAGKTAPVNIDITTLGETDTLPWSDRLLPLIVLITIFLGGLMLPATSLATEKEKKTLEMDTEKAIKLQKSRAISESKLEARKMKLAAKEEVITRAFTMANERLAGLSPSENERYLRNAIQNATTLLGRDLELSCNLKDAALITKLASEIAPGSTVVSDNITFMGGAVIRAKDGSAQIDATFEGLLARMKNTLRKEVAETLFKTETKPQSPAMD